MNTLVQRLLVGSLSMTACTGVFARSSRIHSLIESLIQSVGAVYYTVTLIFILCGIGITAKSLMGLYRLSQDGQQAGISAFGCIVGIIVGGMLTAVGVIAVMISNSLGA